MHISRGEMGNFYVSNANALD